MSLARALGAGSAFSGLIVGVYRGGGAFGSFALWAALKARSDTWRHSRTIFACVMLLQVICASVVFSVCAYSGMYPQWALRGSLLAARLVQGMGGGIFSSLASNLVAHLVPPSERPARMLSINLAWTMGLGLAPFLSGAANTLVAPMAQDIAITDYQVMASVGVWLPLLSLLCILYSQTPTKLTTDDEGARQLGDLQKSCSEGDQGPRRVIVVLCCLAAMPVRAFGIASLESALSYLLEVTHGWDTRLVAFTAAATFLSCLPLKAFYDHFKHVFTVTSWVRIWVGLSLVGVLMLHPAISSGVPLLLLACTISFPTLFLSGGLLNGIMQNHCFPGGSILDLNTCIFWAELGTNVFGRFLGPPTARWALGQAGQGAYWCQQLVVAAAAVILTEVVVHLQSEALMASPAAGQLKSGTHLAGGGGTGDSEEQQRRIDADSTPVLDAHADDAQLAGQAAPRTTLASVAVVKDDVAFAYESACEVTVGGRPGFELCPEVVEEQTVQLEAIPANASLDREGVEVLSCLEELRAAGVTEESDLGKQATRVKVGEAMTQALAKRFGSMTLVHVADTSRVSGLSVAGEATVRDTMPGKACRKAQGACHIDHFLPGVAKCFGTGAGMEEGADALIDSYWHLWSADLGPLGISKAAARECLLQRGMVNVWTALTPGGVRQHPLAVIDKRSIDLEGDQAFQSFNTLPICFPGLTSTLTALRKGAVPSTRWLFKPEMRFGDMLLFSTTETPHAAVRLCNMPDAHRQSAEMRFFLFSRT